MSSRANARNIADLIGADRNLARLSAHASQLLKLQRIFEHAVPAALAKHGRVANMKLGKVVIHASNGSVAAKIRQLTPRLTDAFRQAEVDVNQIQVKAQPNAEARAIEKPNAPASIGIRTKQGLTSLAQKLPDDSPLKAALQRLAERANIRTTEQ